MMYAYRITPLLFSLSLPQTLWPSTEMLCLLSFTGHDICSKTTDLPLDHQNKSLIPLEMVPQGTLQATSLSLIQRQVVSTSRLNLHFLHEYEYNQVSASNHYLKELKKELRLVASPEQDCVLLQCSAFCFFQPPHLHPAKAF